MKKLVTLIVAILIVATCCFALTACDNGETVKPYEGIQKIENLSDIKFGLICLHDENSTYDKNFIDAFKSACQAKGVSMVIKTGIPENDSCYEAACDLVDEGCNIIFADSFGHEQFLLKAANEYPNVQFCHATGTTAHTEKRGNFHNAFADIYQGRYLAGIAAGVKLASIKDTLSANNKDSNGNIKIGYVGAFPYAEVKSGYTSWFLGVKAGYAYATNTDALTAPIVMEVLFTGEWYHEAKEKTAAESLINKGCALISQHADSMGAPTACETANVPNVSYNGSTATACPNTFIISSKINWQPYYEYVIDCVNKGEEIALDYTGTIANNSVELTALGNAAAEGTQEAINAFKAQITSGTLQIFDCSKFTVEGQHLTSYLADVDSDAEFAKDTEVIKTEGNVCFFSESEFRSAPYFDIDIDGITLPKID